MKWITKSASLLVMAASLLVSCDEKAIPDSSSSMRTAELAISFDKNVIMNDGNDAVTLKAYYKGQDVSDAAVFYRVVPDKLVPEVMNSRRFASTTVGKYAFKVGYNSAYSDEAVITVTDMDLPQAVEDHPQPGDTSFVHRAFLNQHTGTGCGYCPYLIRLLRQTLVGDVKDKAVLAAIRNYDDSEKVVFAYVTNPSNTWPFLHVDYKDSYDFRLPAAGLVEKIEAIASTPAKVGISANPVYYPDQYKIAVRVAVKAAVAGEYNVGLWLMQDNFYKVQSDYDGIGDSTYDTHHNCVRIAESLYSGSHIGMPLGNLAKGETAEWVFMFDIKDGIEKNKLKGGWWESFSPEKLNDLHFAAFVTTPYVTSEGYTSYEVVNAIDFPYNQPTPFDYKN